MQALDKEALASIDHPFAKHLLLARQWQKLANDFVGSIRKNAVRGRLHPRYHATRSQSHNYDLSSGVAFGRLSCTNPNIQQQPIRHKEYGKLWRSIFLPDAGSQFIAADYAAQEPRMTVDLGVSCGMPSAIAFAKKWQDDPHMDVHQAVAEICGIGRIEAKTINLGLTYGMSGGKLCRSLGLPTVKKTNQYKTYDAAGPEGEALMERYKQRFPFMHALFYKCQKVAKERGWVKTLYGRICHFTGGAQCYAALNRVIQGSAADQTKQALVNADAAGLPIQLQVHDEITMSGNQADGEKLRHIMEDAVKLSVPSVVDCGMGANWGESKE
jgi:DNA polymerase I-like protein with 3'-5' exonuclease and polymerase domains